MSQVQEEHLSKYEKELIELLHRKQSEIKANQNQLKEQYGIDVTYGEEVQFMHFISKSFLNGKILCSQVDQGAYKFQLSKEYGVGMIFKILPKYKLRQEGENVQFEDQILLYNTHLDSYVNFSTK